MAQKLLIVTQAVDTEDPALGFFVRWIEEFAQHFDRIEIICLTMGMFTVPSNVRVHSLEKERGRPVFGSAAYALRFLRLIWKLRHDYDSVFVHMNPEYVVLGGALWRMLGKRVVLWYAHRAVMLRLRVAACFAGMVATISAASFNLRSRKVRTLGHGIDTDAFRNPHPSRTLHDPIEIICVGRVTPIKDQGTAIRALALLRDQGFRARLTFVGAPTVARDEKYAASLRRLVREKGLEGQVTFAGAVVSTRMPEHYWANDISLNLCPTGGLDKVVFESMAAGVPPLVANCGFETYLGSDASRLLFAHGDPRNLANRIRALAVAPDLREVKGRLVETARQKADVRVLVAAVVRLLEVPS